MKKFFTIALVLFALIATFSVSCFAYGEEPSDTSVAEKEETPTENFFGIVYREILENSDRLLAALAFAGSLLVAFAYKKGLLPLIKASLGALSAAVARLKDESEKASAEACDAILSASDKLDSAGEVIDALGKRLESIEKQLKAANDRQKKGESIYSVINTQIDMLYEVFMSSSLPAYQKEAVGERVAEMKRSLAESSDKAVISGDE